MTPPWSRRPCTQPITVTARPASLGRSVPRVVAAFPVAERGECFSHRRPPACPRACGSVAASAGPLSSTPSARAVVGSGCRRSRTVARPARSSSSPSRTAKRAASLSARRMALFTLRPAASSSQRMPSARSRRASWTAAARRVGRERDDVDLGRCASGAAASVGHQRAARDRSRSRCPAAAGRRAPATRPS